MATLSAGQSVDECDSAGVPSVVDRHGHRGPSTRSMLQSVKLAWEERWRWLDMTLTSDEHLQKTIVSNLFIDVMIFICINK